jgi:CRP-like cAMP-binding protein
LDQETNQGAGAGEAAGKGPVTDEERGRLIARYGRSFSMGDALFREGDPARHAFMLQQGRVRLLKRVRMVERSIVVLRPGDLFGESALLDDAPRTSTAVALTDGIALALDQETFRHMVERHPAVAVRLSEQLIRRVRDAEDQIEVMMLRDNQSKIVSCLIKLARAASDRAELAVTPVELSTRVGLDVDTVKRGVQRLREQQYVRIVGERVEIPDMDALRRLYVLLGAKEELKGAER